MISYERLKEIYKDVYAVDGLNMDQLGVLYNLVGYLYLAYKKKDAKLTVYDLFYKVGKVKAFDADKEEFVWKKLEDFDSFVIPFSLQLEHMISANKFKPDIGDLKDVKSIVNNINEVLDKWFPF